MTAHIYDELEAELKSRQNNPQAEPLPPIRVLSNDFGEDEAKELSDLKKIYSAFPEVNLWVLSDATPSLLEGLNILNKGQN